jgi:alkylation response protein AidB-like acyl-CoA dehydrogenase
MDFSDTPEQAAFRADARRFLEANAEPRRGSFETWTGRHGEAEGLARAKAFQAKAAAGFAAIRGPWSTEGAGLADLQVIWGQEESRFFVPRGFYETGLACAS